MRPLRIATRGSLLALTQTRSVAARLRALIPGLEVHEEVVRTAGDVDQRPDLAELTRSAGVGFFVREVEAALLDGRADMAVHSLKDLPVESRSDLAVAAVPEREDPRDGLAPRPADWTAGEDPIALLPRGATVGTGSPRRRAQILLNRPDLEVVPVRGNVPTRLAKAGPGAELDAVVLAMAGLRRLGLDAGACPIPSQVLLPAPGQGALALQCRDDDMEVRALLASLEDRDARAATTAERAFLGRLEGGCALPAGALGEVKEGRLHLRVLVAEPEGGQSLSEAGEADAEEAAELGRELAQSLLDRGAAGMLGRGEG